MNWLKWLCPGINVKRWIMLLVFGLVFVIVGTICLLSNQFQDLFSNVLDLANNILARDFKPEVFIPLGVGFIFSGILFNLLGIRGLSYSLSSVFKAGYEQKFIDVLFAKNRLHNGAAVTVIGGGTGLSVLLRGIKEVTGNCTAVVAVSDDGGSSGRLRNELGIIPPGDLRSCITALADTEPLMSKLMQYRFAEGTSLSGHSFGNLFIAAMADIVGDMEKGLNATSKVLKVRGNVTPTTLTSVSLEAEMTDGSIVHGESNISHAGKVIKGIRLIPENAKATQSAVKAIMDADMLVLGPGSLYSSIITNLLIPGIKEAILKSSAVKVYICNVMTQPSETDGFSAYDHVKTLCDYAGNTFIDFVVINNKKIGSDQLAQYAKQGAFPVDSASEKIRAMGIKVVEADLISEENLVRHDPEQLSKTLIALMYRLNLSGKGIKALDYYFVKNIFRDSKKVV